MQQATGFWYVLHFLKGSATILRGTMFTIRQESRIQGLIRGLEAGDPIIWGATIFVVVLAVSLLLFMLKVRRDMQREDAASAKRAGRRS
ncbi:MAG: hypothetical protein ACRCZF_24360 [Gemmataceae bacterium]